MVSLFEPCDRLESLLQVGADDDRLGDRTNLFTAHGYQLRLGGGDSSPGSPSPKTRKTCSSASSLRPISTPSQRKTPSARWRPDGETDQS